MSDVMERAMFILHTNKLAEQFFADPVCKWCGCSSKSEDFCTECNAPNINGDPYCECPYCGEIYPDTNVTCCGERHVYKRILEE